MGYAFNFHGKAYGPSGPIKDTAGTPLGTNDTDTYNKAVEVAEIASLKTAPDRLFLYVHRVPGEARPSTWQIRTWPCTVVSTVCHVGPKSNAGGIAGRYTFKRSVECRIYGTRYVGWYYESAGDYCRLRKAVRQ